MTYNIEKIRLQGSFRQLLVLVGMMLLSVSLNAQCPDFTDLSGSGVVCQSGYSTDPLQNTGLVIGRHTLITTQGSDPRTGNQLPLLPPGESRVIKLGNEQGGGEGEAITYTFTVDPDHAILLLNFAVVFEHHPELPQPLQSRFVVRVLNENDSLTEACAEYDVSVNSDIPGFQTYMNGSQLIRWRPWTNVGIDLSDYIGQTVKVRFITADCLSRGAFGYAYFTAHCISNRLALADCNGDTVTLAAPTGFSSYQWNNGSTDTTAQYVVSGTGTSANCLITSATGCQFMLNAFISSQGNLPTQTTPIYDTICQGDTYTDNFFNLPAQNELGTFTHRNSFFNSVDCSGEITTTLFLTVIDKYYDIYDTICYGEDYHEYGFHILQPAVGTMTETLNVNSLNGCDSIITLHLTVNSTFTLSNHIVGEIHPCENEVYTYSLPNAENLSTFQWVVPQGVTLVSGQGTSSIDLLLIDTAATPFVLTLLGANGCGNGALPLTIMPNLAYRLLFTDSLCSGNEYHCNGFDLPRQDSTGSFTFINRYQTAAGCDSVRVLLLTVTATPEIAILAMPEMLCEGEDADLHALGSQAGFVTGGTPPAIAIGDILCTDNSTVKPAAFAGSGKTAMGIVFYVDRTGMHGWATSLYDVCTNCCWGPYNDSWLSYTSSDDVPALPNYATARTAITDLNGMSNTMAIKNYYGSNFYNCQAAFKAYYYNHLTNTTGTVPRGWYLPAAGQLNYLHAQIYPINTSLALVGGTQFLMSLYSYEYWSSTEGWALFAWIVSNNGNVGGATKDTYSENSDLRVRSVRDF